MRQRITVDQLNELTPEQKERLREWWKPERGELFAYYLNGSETYQEAVTSIDPSLERYSVCANKKRGDLPLLNIGQCIELLFYHQSRKYYGGALIMYLSKYGASIYSNDRDFENGVSEAEKDELIDALWQAVKEVL